MAPGPIAARTADAALTCCPLGRFTDAERRALLARFGLLVEPDHDPLT